MSDERPSFYGLNDYKFHKYMNGDVKRVAELLEKHDEPLHFKEILRIGFPEIQTHESSCSLRATLNHYCRSGRTFLRTRKATYGLIGKYYGSQKDTPHRFRPPSGSGLRNKKIGRLEVVSNIMKDSEVPLHISDIMKLMHPELECGGFIYQRISHSLTSTLNSYVKCGIVFRKVGKSTYGLRNKAYIYNRVKYEAEKERVDC